MFISMFGQFSPNPTHFGRHKKHKRRNSGEYSNKITTQYQEKSNAQNMKHNQSPPGDPVSREFVLVRKPPDTPRYPQKKQPRKKEDNADKNLDLFG
jgi:hypothetical protein